MGKGEAHLMKEPSINLDRLYYAVAMAESGNCSTEWHKAKANCTSIMTWKSGKRELRKFKNEEEGKAYFKWLWKEHYGNKFPTMKEATRFTGDDRSAQWLENVKKYFNQPYENQ